VRAQGSAGVLVSGGNSRKPAGASAELLGASLIRLRANDGRYPTARLILDSKGNLYGTTELGGAHYWGTVFELPGHGREKVLYSFTDKADGGYPEQLLRDSTGNIYGTTNGGGNLKCNPNGKS
jgi:uncharacterized repeat protein (TIGR03803 family)